MRGASGKLVFKDAEMREPLFDLCVRIPFVSYYLVPDSICMEALFMRHAWRFLLPDFGMPRIEAF